MFPLPAGIDPAVLILIILWTIPWKGYALWRAAKRNHKWWFIILLVVNTVGILEIVYIFLFDRRTLKKEVNDA